MVAVTLLALACSGGGAGVKLDPGKADQLAHAALISEADLPGRGWSVVATDEFDDDDAFLGDNPACKDLSARFDKVLGDLESKRAGRAQREMERSLRGVAFPVSVEVEIVVYRSVKGLAGAVSEFSRIVAASDFSPCFEEAFREGLGDPRATVTTRSVKPLAETPAGGAVTAMELEFALRQPVVQGTFRFEGYRWQFGNVIASVSIVGPREGFTAELVTVAVTQTVLALDRAAGSKAPMPSR